MRRNLFAILGLALAAALLPGLTPAQEMESHIGKLTGHLAAGKELY